MQFDHVFIPYGAYWSTPFVRWQGSFAHLHPMRFAAEVTKRALEERHIGPEVFDALFLGMTVPAKHSFYGAPWLAAMVGAPEISGPAINQACATSARVIGDAAYEVEIDRERCILAITCDRTSNGPHLYYPNPLGPGGTGEHEDWVTDNFDFDPYAHNAMLQTAENVAAEDTISREEQNEVTYLRYQQYQDALKDDAAFHRRYFVSPVEVKDSSGRKKLATVLDDEGIYPTTPEGLARLRPVHEGGTVTYGAQTHPADGNSGLILTSQEQARQLSRDANIQVRLVAFGQARARKGYMAQATVPAAQKALQEAGIDIKDVKVVKTHNPFAVNDIYFSRKMGVALDSFNNFGSSLIFGHPQGPTGMRLTIELIEELVMRGGGYGLFVGCAAGDTGAALIVHVDAK
ncbi:thiolase family protein [Ktedonosporobacter rubrisoli]|uniref:acetyl-CoA C-acetyltransferase n=1 Tax=Ktedonosporobacter rubrisoli TaxID=2509675 RepID=A0A4P6JLK4_KTERU|nr:thiolase family protein [Ktedonosporobacter rubrisoli]QBD76084.1 thiolase family protein [Ktedonosporobacter rubrisoli]